MTAFFPFSLVLRFTYSFKCLIVWFLPYVVSAATLAVTLRVVERKTKNAQENGHIPHQTSPACPYPVSLANVPLPAAYVLPPIGAAEHTAAMPHSI